MNRYPTIRLIVVIWAPIGFVTKGMSSQVLVCLGVHTDSNEAIMIYDDKYNIGSGGQEIKIKKISVEFLAYCSQQRSTYFNFLIN